LKTGHASRETLGALLWVMAFLLTAGLSSLIPPMMSPDESSHINRAYLISQGTFLLQPLAAETLTDSIQNAPVAATVDHDRRMGGRVGGLIDLGLIEFTDNHLALALKVDKRLTSAEKERLDRIGWTEQQRYIAFAGTGYYFPAIYVPQALGLALGQALRLSVAHSYQLARTLTLLTCFSLLWLASSLWLPNLWVTAILLLPMSLFQLMSPTIDGLSTALAVLAITLFLQSADPGRRHPARFSWGLVACIFLIITSRTHLLPMLLLPFFLAWQRQSRRDFYLGCCAALAAMAWILFALKTTTDARIVRDHTSTELLMLYATEPMAFLKVVISSFTNHDLFNFYERSFIGILGWLDAPLPSYFYPTLWTGLALSGLLSISVSTLREDWRARLLLLAIALASAGMIFLALLVTWTPHPATVVEGVQGRYFVVPMLLLGYALSGFSAPQARRRRGPAAVTLAGFALASLSALTMTLLGRYH